MAFGLILWVSYLALLLSAKVDLSLQDSRYTPDNQNLEDPSVLFDEGDLTTQLAGLVPPNYIQPSVKQPPSLIPAGQTPANTENGNSIVHIVNGEAREWDSNLFEPITFPLQQKQTFNQPQSAPIYTSKKFVSPSLVEGSFENKNVATKPASSPPNVAVFPSFQSWQPASTVVEGSPFGSLNQKGYTASSPGGDSSKPVFGRPDNSEDSLSSGFNMLGFSSTKNGPTLEQVSNKYPSVSKTQRPAALNPAWFGQGNDVTDSYPLWKPSFQGPVGGLPYYKDWMGFPFSSFGDDNLYYGQMALQPQNFVSNTGKYWIPQMSLTQRAMKPTSPRPLRKNFVVRSKSGYQRRRVLQSKTTYIPGYEKYPPEYETPRKYRKSPAPFKGPAQKLIRRPGQEPIGSKV